MLRMVLFADSKYPNWLQFAELLHRKAGIEKLRFTFSKQSIDTTNYTGFDPTTNNGQPIGNGIDYRTYPTAKTYLLGMNIKF